MPPNQDNLSKIFLDLGRKLNSSENSENFLQETVDVATDLTESEGSSILLFEEDTHQLFFAAARSPNREQLMKIRVPIENSIAGWVYHQGSPLNVINGLNEPLIYRVVDNTLEQSTRNLLAVPITFGEETLGTLEVINKNGEYDSDDQEILNMLASFAATAVRLNGLLKKEKEVIQEREELKQQKSDFTSITSHELRSPIGLILGHATFLNEIIQDDFYQEQLNAIINNAEKLKDIIENINLGKDLDKGSARIRWQKTDLNKLLNSVVNTYKDFATENQISIGISTPQMPIFIYCDAAKLSVAIGNVIKNGVIFSDPGKGIHVSLHKLPGHAQISITDAGIGIPSDDIQLIFERFYQVESHLTRTRGGMGLGLSVSKAIVESHGGYIWVESVLGKGSTFSILLPTKEKLE